MRIEETERMTGYRVERLTTRSPVVSFAAYHGRRLVTASAARVEKQALDELENLVLALHRKEVTEAAGYRCVECHAFRVSVHHIIFRTHGGTHQKSNLKVLCSHCHEGAHGR